VGEEFRGYSDVLPERLDHSPLEDLLAAVPFSMRDS
jgi:hypothetical protein